MSDPIVVVPYDPIWPVRFRIESQLLKVALDDLSPVIEHVGSTSIPALAAKPVIDMLVGVASLATFESQAERLTMYGYEYLPEYESVLPHRRLFKRAIRGIRTHHVHVVQLNGAYWKHAVKFRNTLRGDAWLASRYAELKRMLAGRFRYDRDAYTNGKTAFIEAVLAMPSGSRQSAPVTPEGELEAA